MRIVFCGAAVAAIIALTGGGCGGGGDEHAGHDHREPAVAETGHEGHGHEAGSEGHVEEGGHADEHGHADEGGHSEEGEHVELAEEGIKLAGIEVDTAVSKPLGQTVILPGEIGFNEDRLANVVPRYPGIVRSADKRLGEYVEEGEVLAVVESNESLNRYSVKAPIAGRIVRKKVTPGEFAGGEEPIYVVANMATVWANCEVYTGDIGKLNVGQQATIRAVGTDAETTAKLSYIAPVYDETKRSAIVRAVVINTDGKWRPGTFVSAEILVASETPVLAVRKAAVQVLGNQTIVFAPESEHAFVARPVVTGMSTPEYTQIVSGLEEGDIYVASGAFELKARIVTSSLGGHAGHGH